jgi:hypothetical protein
MPDAVIIDAVRTPGGRRNGKLKDWHPAALAAYVLGALAERNHLDPAVVDDVIMGCVMQVGEQSLNIGRNAVLAAGWPESERREGGRVGVAAPGPVSFVRGGGGGPGDDVEGADPGDPEDFGEERVGDR